VRRSRERLCNRLGTFTEAISNPPLDHPGKSRNAFRTILIGAVLSLAVAVLINLAAFLLRCGPAERFNGNHLSGAVVLKGCSNCQISGNTWERNETNEIENGPFYAITNAIDGPLTNVDNWITCRVVMIAGRGWLTSWSTNEDGDIFVTQTQIVTNGWQNETQKEP